MRYTVKYSINSAQILQEGKKLVWQMNMLADFVAEMRQTSLAFSSLKSVTNVRTLIDIVNTLPLTVGIFSEVANIFLEELKGLFPH